MTISALQTTIVVLQGEVAAVQNTDEHTYRLKSSKPTSCNLLTLYNGERKIAAMAHIDDYTNILSAINKIEAIMRRKFDASLTSLPFQCQVMGGSSDEFSVNQKNELKQLLQQMNITYEEVPLDNDRPQVAISAEDGQLELTNVESQNKTLEFLQGREYGDFNNYLDINYANLPGFQIPSFRAKETDREEFQIDSINRLHSREWIAQAQLLESMGFVSLKLRSSRVEILPYDAAKNTIARLVYKHFSTSKPLCEALQNSDFPMLMRRASADPKCIELFEELVANATALSIPLTAKGKTSGTVWDVIAAKGNDKALEILKRF